jgi:hypothetical protein
MNRPSLSYQIYSSDAYCDVTIVIEYIYTYIVYLYYTSNYARALQRDTLLLISPSFILVMSSPHNFPTSLSSLSYYNLVVVFTTLSSLDATSFISRTRHPQPHSLSFVPPNLTIIHPVHVIILISLTSLLYQPHPDLS